MSNVIVLASAHTTDRKVWAGLRDTCELHGVQLKVLGTDKPLGYPSNDPRLFLESAPETLAFLRSTDAEYIVQTDSFDVLCARWDASEVERLCQDAKGNLLVSCEANCFPDGPWRATYDALCETPWRYPNAGQYCGTRKAVLAFVERLLEGMRCLPIDNPFGGAAQEILHRLFLEGYPMSLDYKCDAFQSLYTDASNWVSWDGPHHRGDSGSHIAMGWDDGNSVRFWRGRSPKNMKTGGVPLFLHFNGRAPCMPEWYFMITGNPLPISLMRPEYTPYGEIMKERASGYSSGGAILKGRPCGAQ